MNRTQTKMAINGEYTVTELVTPGMAENWLTLNTHNRTVYPSKVTAYARDMKGGSWKLTHQGIAFDRNGILIDGQHRLLACIMANVPFESKVTYGLEPEAQEVIDGGKIRGVSDQLKLATGMDNARAKVAIANGIVATIKGASRVVLSKSIAEKVIDLYADEIEFIMSCQGKVLTGLRYTPVLTALVLAAKVDLDKAVSFKDKYFKGADLSATDPAFCLRTYMLRRCGRERVEGSRDRLTITILTMSALMNSFLGKPIKVLKTSGAALDYFINKQKTCVEMITEWLAV